MLPTPHLITSIKKESKDTLSFTLKTQNTLPLFNPGQFNLIYMMGFGVAAISHSGDPDASSEIMHTIRAVGDVTRAIYRLEEGEYMYLKGPYGKGWPRPNVGDDIILLAGGIGLAPLRPLLISLEKNRANYGKITLLHGARSPEHLLYKEDLKRWQTKGIDIVCSVDVADLSWKGNVGVIPSFIQKSIMNPDKTLVLGCGPEIMIHFCVQELLRAKVSHQNIYFSLERNMQCATGMCGHCQLGPFLLCRDGPVLSFQQIKPWIEIPEL
ncbi:MAG: Ni/Fe hydrogenase subunit gamma [Chlamydiae bacterium]|nr:Ni/Fe hydrogenase subunit gamma [Chlamydiota bacterium]